jgi:hypothetical protein
MSVELEIYNLARPTQRSYRFDEQTVERLNKLSNRLGNKTETQIITDAIGHLLGSLERDQPIWMTAPSESQKSHKRPSNAA